jgi:biotin carboxyl carrier protein
VQFDVEVNGRIRRVRVNRAQGGYLVAVDDRDWTIDVARIDAQTLSLLIGTSSYDVSIVPGPASDQLTVSVGSVVLGATLNGRRRRGRKEEPGSAEKGPQQLKAPMPGKVVRVLVKLGDEVRSRQPLVVIEAMKMENELRAAAEGVVSELRVVEGQSVEAGAVVAVVRPA